MRNQREEYGKTLVTLGEENPSVVVLEADLGKSTMSCLFEAAYPKCFFEMGIAEANMTGFAAGLALGGKIPFTNSFAVFSAGRAYDQIRQSICTANLHVIIVGSSAGLSDFGDGATHQSIDDLGIMSVLPNMTVLCPCDGAEVPLAVRAAVAMEGPVYIRLCRNNLEDIYPEGTPYKVGEPVVLRAGGDVGLFTTGILAHQALAAANTLAEAGIGAQVVHLPGIKPLNREAVRGLAEGKRLILTCEEHSVYGGLNAVVSQILSGTGTPVEAIAVMDRFGQSAHSHEELLHHYKLDAEAITERVRSSLNG